MNNCHICDKDKYLSFRWRNGIDRQGSDPAVAVIVQNLVFLESLKFGKIYRCKDCSQHWYLNDAESAMYRVAPELTTLVFKWSDASLTPNEAQIKSLQDIGASSCKNEVISIPCKANLYSNDLAEPCMAIISKMPPILSHTRKPILGSSVSYIQSSEYALPLDVRMATNNAVETSMCFAPTRVYAGSYRCVLNDSQNFFYLPHQGLKGPDVSLSSEEFIISNFHMSGSHALPPISNIYFDWFEGCEAYFGG